MRAPAIVYKQAQIEEAVNAVASDLAPDVARIRFTVEPDWSGDWSIEFRTLLTDAASRKRRRQLIAQTRDRLTQAIKPDEAGLLPYFSFRTESEQEELQEESWA